MKSIIAILLFVVTAFPTIAFSQLNSNVRSKDKLNQNRFPRKNSHIQSNIPYSISNIVSAYAYDSIRSLTEINVPNQGEMLPWISADGLRLYYINGWSPDSIMFTQRANTNSNFSSPTRLPISVFDPYSFWLSKDELDIYVCKYLGFVYAHRDSISLPFNTPVEISLLGITPTTTEPSLNSAQDEIFLYYFINHGIIRISRSSPTSFTYTGDLLVPSGYSIGSSQLSKDDLTIFLEVTQPTSSRLYQMTRATPNDSFDTTTFQEIQGINDTSVYNGQPSMSDSLTWVAFVRSPYNLWQGMDLFLAQKETLTSVFNHDDLTRSLLAYPNPSTDQITIRTSSFQDNSQLSIMNLTGQELISQQLSESKMVIDISSLPSGVYFVRLINDKTVEVGKIIKQ